MKNKKGFTLIELLAVIVILAVIMVIAVPKILNVIESSRTSAADSSLKLVRSAIKTQVTTSSMSSVNFTSEDGCYLFDFTNNNSNVQNLSLKNKDKVSGSIKYCSGKLNDDTLAWDGQTANKEPEKPAQLTNDLDSNGQADIGDTITIGEENFYVISNDGSTISILAYYNLNAGGIYNGSTWTKYESPTYIQDETMKGFDANDSSTNIRRGTMPFSTADEPKWDSTSNATISSDWYSSYITTALNEYSKKITTSMGKTMTARLITKLDIEKVINNGAVLSASNIKSLADTQEKQWIYNGTYWISTSVQHFGGYVWVMYSDGKLNNGLTYRSTDTVGIRPVFDISVSDI